MTWSMTLADLPIAGKTSKPHDYQQNVQKMQDLSKTWVFNEKRVWKLQTKKEKKQNSPPFKNTLWNTVPLNTTVHSNKYCAGYKINSLGPKSLLKTLSVEKKQGNLSSEKKIIWPFFLLLSSLTNLKEQILTVRKVFWQLLCKWQDHFFGT